MFGAPFIVMMRVPLMFVPLLFAHQVQFPAYMVFVGLNPYTAYPLFVVLFPRSMFVSVEAYVCVCYGVVAELVVHAAGSGCCLVREHRVGARAVACYVHVSV